VVFWRFWV